MAVKTPQSQINFSCFSWAIKTRKMTATQYFPIYVIVLQGKATLTEQQTNDECRTGDVYRSGSENSRSQPIYARQTIFTDLTAFTAFRDLLTQTDQQLLCVWRTRQTRIVVVVVIAVVAVRSRMEVLQLLGTEIKGLP